MQAFKWDYHLNKKEQEYIDHATPDSQAKVQLACRADIEVRKKLYRAGAVALTEHFVLLFRKAMFGKKFKRSAAIHVLTIVMAQTKSETELIIETAKENIKIRTPIAVRMARYLMKNYGLSVYNVPPNMRLAFRSYDSSAAPAFNLVISPSQAFQFAFNAESSLYGTPYIHEIAEFYHRLILHHNCTFDVNNLPLCLVSDRFEDAADPRALLGALRGDKFVYAVTATDVDLPSAVVGAASILSTNSDLKLLRLKNCGAVEGPAECAVAIEQNHNLHLEFLDLSENHFEKITPLISALCAKPNELWYLDLNYTNMTQKDLVMLLKGIVKENRFPQLRYLHLLGVELTSEASALLCEWVDKDECHLESLEIEGDVLSVVDSLGSGKKQLTRLVLRTPKIGPDLAHNLLVLLNYVGTLTYLDISHAAIGERDFLSIIDKINTCEPISYMTLKLDGMKVNEKIVEEISRGSPTKYSGFSFTEVEMNDKVFRNLCRYLQTVQDLRELVLDGGFRDMKALAKVPVTNLRITGNKHICELLPELKSNTTVKAIHFDECPLGNKGYKHLAALIRENTQLQEIWVDNGGCETIEPILECMRAAADSPAVFSAVIGVNDMINIVLAAKKKGHEPLQKFKTLEKEMSKKNCESGMSMGLKTSLQLMMIPKLDELLGDCLGLMNQRMSEVNVQTHSAICKILDLPLPFQQSHERYTAGDNEDYGVLKTLIQEKVDDSISSFQTLQLNSVAIPDHVRMRPISGVDLQGIDPPVRPAGTKHENKDPELDFGFDDDDD